MTSTRKPSTKDILSKPFIPDVWSKKIAQTFKDAAAMPHMTKVLSMPTTMSVALKWFIPDPFTPSGAYKFSALGSLEVQAEGASNQDVLWTIGARVVDDRPHYHLIEHNYFADEGEFHMGRNIVVPVYDDDAPGGYAPVALVTFFERLLVVEAGVTIDPSNSQPYKKWRRCGDYVADDPVVMSLDGS